MPAATLRRISMKALARYQVILLGEQRHTRCEQLARIVQRPESNLRPLDHESSALTTTPPSHLIGMDMQKVAFDVQKLYISNSGQGGTKVTMEDH